MQLFPKDQIFFPDFFFKKTVSLFFFFFFNKLFIELEEHPFCGFGFLSKARLQLLCSGALAESRI